MFDVFENPWGILILAFVALLVVLVVRAVCTGKRRLWLFLIPVLLAVLAFGLDITVKTDLEKIRNTIKALAEAVEEEDADALEKVLAENYYDSFHRSKDAMIRNFKSRLSYPLFEKIIASVQQIEISPAKTSSDVKFSVRVIFTDQSFVAQNYRKMVFVRINMKLQKQQNNWFVSQVELVELDWLPAKWEDVQSTPW